MFFSVENLFLENFLLTTYIASPTELSLYYHIVHMT